MDEAREDVLSPSETEKGDVIGPAGQRLSRQPSAANLTQKRWEQLLAYCKLMELADDPEVAALLPGMYAAAVAYMEDAGVRVPESDTPRRALYDLCVNYLTLDAWDRRETAVVATVVADNPEFRRKLNQLQWTEP